jgi:hypothetical protein
VINIIDEVIGARRSDAQVSVVTYITLAALNRVVAPCSKLSFSELVGPQRPRSSRLRREDVRDMTFPSR